MVNVLVVPLEFPIDKRTFDFHTDLHVTAIHTHASDHAALSGHICPVDHLLCIVEVQCHCIIQTLNRGRYSMNSCVKH